MTKIVTPSCGGFYLNVDNQSLAIVVALCCQLRLSLCKNKRNHQNVDAVDHLEHHFEIQQDIGGCRQS